MRFIPKKVCLCQMVAPESMEQSYGDSLEGKICKGNERDDLDNIAVMQRLQSQLAAVFSNRICCSLAALVETVRKLFVIPGQQGLC